MENKIKDFADKMQIIEYGWIDKDGKKYLKHLVKDKFITDYYLQKPEEVWEHKIGICWDQVEVEREFFVSKKIPCQSIFIVNNDNKKMPLHTVLVFKANDKYGWIENTYESVKEKVRYYKTITEMMEDITKEFIKENKIDENDLNIFYFIYKKPNFGIGAQKFGEHCQKGTLVKKDFSNITF